jgi:lysozyme
MTDPRKPVFDAVRGELPHLFNDPGNILALDNLLDAFGYPRTPARNSKPVHPTDLTEAMVLEILEHEALVLEAYKDSEGVWTWAGGITSESGHMVERYRDNPQTLEHCIAVTVWLLRNTYLPEVRAAFGSIKLTTAQLTAALSFHWNTGKIDKAEWVKSFRRGEITKARAEFMNWSRPTSIIPRRKAERNLFFDGVWTHDGKVTVYPVRKPSYYPHWGKARQVDVREAVAAALERGA